MVGSAIVRALEQRRAAGQDLTILTRTRSEVDLTDRAAVRAFLAAESPDVIICAAARVGGIFANNTYPAEFIQENLDIACTLVHEAHAADVQSLLFLGSSCIYPRETAQPIPEEALLTGPLEPTNEPYAIAKIAAIKLCESYNRQYGRDYRSVMPCNLYGPGDNFHPENSHVIPALLRRFHDAARSGAKSVTIWGTGRARREFLHVDDLAAGSLFVMNLSPEAYAAQTKPMRSHLNIGAGSDLTVWDLANLIGRTVGFTGRILTDTTRPDGTPRKLLDTTRITELGWRPGISLSDGLAETYRWYAGSLPEPESSSLVSVL